MTLGRAKILTSENDASVSQNTNINIRIAKSTGNIPQQPVNFTTPACNTKFPTNQCAVQEQDMGQNSSTNSMSNSEHRNALVDFANELEEKRRMLELLLSIYEDNPLRINNYLVCNSKTLMELIKNMTYADKVELLVDEDSGCTGCVSNAKYMHIEKILITKDGVSTELKHTYNNIYTELIRHGISLKLCI